MPYDRSACFLLRPRGTLRFGSHADDPTGAHPFPSSDTIFGALAWAVAASGGEEAAARWMEPFVHGKPPVLISSALPCDEPTSTPLLPRPQRRREGDISGEINRKLLKRAEYVDPGALAWFSGKSDELPVASGRLLIANPAAFQSDRWITLPAPGVTIDRVASASSVYSVGLTHYSVSLAVYALAESDAALDALEGLIDLLSVTGIGGRRSRGSGQFTWRRTQCPLNLAATPAGMALSLVWPRPDELEAAALSPAEGFGYRIARRQGWIGSPPWSSERSRTVAMLGEGSYLRPGLASPVGGLADVTPLDDRGRHRVYRYGCGLFLDEGLA